MNETANTYEWNICKKERKAVFFANEKYRFFRQRRSKDEKRRNETGRRNPDD